MLGGSSSAPGNALRQHHYTYKNKGDCSDCNSAQACSDFGLTISFKKTNIPGQDFSITPSISIGDYTPRSGEGLHLPRLHHLQQPLPRYSTEQKDKQSSRITSTSRREGLGQHPDSTPCTCAASEGFWASCLAQAGEPSCWIGWFRHVSRMEAGRIPKDILYGELATGCRRPVVSKMQFLN